MNTCTDADFDRLSWHDCYVRGLEIRAGDPAVSDWTADLAFELDFILEWVCGVRRPCAVSSGAGHAGVPRRDGSAHQRRLG